MKKTYMIAVIGCVLILGAALIAGCIDSSQAAEKITESTHPTGSIPPVSTVFTTVPTGTSPASDTTFRTLYLNSTANGEIVTIPVGDRVLVRLRENPTTGYTWNVTAARGISVISDTYTAPNSSLKGATGYHEWLIAPQTVDTYIFKTVYLRPWVGATASDDTFSLVIQATKA